jgi:hypothetical protein
MRCGPAAESGEERYRGIILTHSLMQSNLRFVFVAAAIVFQGDAIATDISDPAAFVKDVYRRIVSSARYTPPSDIYTPRLKALFDEDARRAKGEVGCIDFDFWTNAQDPQLKDVRIASKAVPGKADRVLVIATFSEDGPQEIHFDFQKIGGKWLLDDASALTGERWTLSKLLKCW